MRNPSILALAGSPLPILSSATDGFDIIGITKSSTCHACPAISGCEVLRHGYDGSDGDSYMTTTYEPAEIDRARRTGRRQLSA